MHKNLPEFGVVAEVLPVGVEHVVLQPQDPSQHGQVLVLNYGRPVGRQPALLQVFTDEQKISLFKRCSGFTL